MDRVDWVILGIVVLILYGLFSGFMMVVEREKQLGLEKQEITQMGKELEQHKFLLKEMKLDSSISGNMRGSFLFIGGSIYGQINENKYLNVVYYDNDEIIDSITEVYRITKFDLENIQIVTIQKNETPYYKYVDNTYQFCSWEDLDCEYLKNNYKLKLGVPRLFLPDGWAILNN
jgi:hypothetical protein